MGVDTFTSLVEGLCDSAGTVGLCDSTGTVGLCDSTGVEGTITVDVEVDGGATRGPAGFGPEAQSKPI